jgi:uncharacterized protein YprB with RNaseH-like and TPR domain
MRTAYLDIETTSKKANEGMVITIGILVDEEPELKFAGNEEEEKAALQWLKEKLRGCELIVTWYGSGFDIPFLQTRGLAHGILLEELAEIPLLDLCEWSRAHLLLSSYSLKSVARFLRVWGEAEFTGPDMPTLFKLSSRGDSEAKYLIVQHCREDLILLKRVHEKLRPLLERRGGSPRRPSPGR